MITLRKFLQLKPGTRKRKLVRIIGDYEQFLAGKLQGNKTAFLRFFEDLERNLPQDLVDPGEWHNFVRAANSIHAGFAANRLRHLLMDEIGAVAADWDEYSGPSPGSGGQGGPGFDPGPEYRDPMENKLDLGDPPRLPHLPPGGRGLYLDDIRAPFNVGAVFRTAAFFGISPIIVSPDTPKPGTPRLDKTSMGMSFQSRWGVLSREDFINSFPASGAGDRAADTIPPLYLLETGGEAIGETLLKSGGWLILGNEELGVHPDLLELSRELSQSAGSGELQENQKSRILSIPGSGKKASLNVSVAFGIAAAYWCDSREV
ncbi:TrmH family RNA methyltransferase [Salinispira pacifica]|uniref:RNA methyltransferase, TrmH family n=1 Tax=Salinispira pacifica TaxID=1307761 RepID=V5WEJ7_9SPIO|nr:TrmH family RNA methyltransferase [Salinispira pacifica]AHC13581.1 RNA methyltransferase, TrmH family [Salinispira pacifica]